MFALPIVVVAAVVFVVVAAAVAVVSVVPRLLVLKQPNFTFRILCFDNWLRDEVIRFIRITKILPEKSIVISRLISTYIELFSNVVLCKQLAGTLN